ncbi:8287_t:CDS:2 [Entrophospora sp. SA101]|nr:8287_t:CDS:2 [Entrophospora sp. SA101]CAJ0910509.1 17148_t:CDS:2 [Entrophospora sp. SA101]
MQRELDSLRKVEKTYAVKTRELELDNDDLERTERAAKSSLQDLENKYNKAIERNAILENELEGKNILIVQSLEARLVSCRSLVTPLLAPPPSYSTTMPLQNGINSPPLSPKISRFDSPYITSLKEKRRNSVQKSKFNISPTPTKLSSFGRV